MLFNLSNHSVVNWPDKQLKAAKEQFGNVVDIPFPQIDPLAGEKEIIELAESYLQKCKKLIEESIDETNAVHLMGEFTFVFALAYLLIKNNIVCVVSTTHRNTVEVGNKKISEFKFVRFRKYLYEI